MKILHIQLTEYDTLEELQSNFYKRTAENGIQLMKTKEKAEENLTYQHKMFGNLGSQIFWWEKGDFKGVTTYILYETIYD